MYMWVCVEVMVSVYMWVCVGSDGQCACLDVWECSLVYICEVISAHTHRI